MEGLDATGHSCVSLSWSQQGDHLLLQAGVSIPCLVSGWFFEVGDCGLTVRGIHKNIQCPNGSRIYRKRFGDIVVVLLNWDKLKWIEVKW